MADQQQSLSDFELGTYKHLDVIAQGKIRKLADHLWELGYKELSEKMHDLARNNVDLKKEDGFG